MRLRYLSWLILSTSLLLAPVALAWQQSIEIGGGASHDPNDSKHINSGVMLSGDFLTLYDAAWYRFNLNAALGRWYSNAPDNKNVTTGAVSVALRAYPFTIECEGDNLFYFLLSEGPAFYSKSRFGMNYQGGNTGFQSIAGLGIERDNYDFNLRAVHYSNAGLHQPNQGYNILFVVSVGYLFD